MPYERHIGAPGTFSQHHAGAISSKPTSMGLLSRLKGENYVCSRCANVTPKRNAKVSGYDSENSLRHIHCPHCGKIIAWPSEGSKLKSIVEGASLAVAGGALAFLLYPSLSIYGLQAGLFASLYGVLKILIL